MRIGCRARWAKPSFAWMRSMVPESRGPALSIDWIALRKALRSPSWMRRSSRAAPGANANRRWPASLTAITVRPASMRTHGLGSSATACTRSSRVTMLRIASSSSGRAVSSCFSITASTPAPEGREETDRSQSSMREENALPVMTVRKMDAVRSTSSPALPCSRFSSRPPRDIQCFQFQRQVAVNMPLRKLASVKNLEEIIYRKTMMNFRQLYSSRNAFEKLS